MLTKEQRKAAEDATALIVQARGIFAKAFPDKKHKPVVALFSFLLGLIEKRLQPPVKCQGCLFGQTEVAS